MYGGLRAKGEKPDLALVTCDVDAIYAGWLLWWSYRGFVILFWLFDLFLICFTMILLYPRIVQSWKNYCKNGTKKKREEEESYDLITGYLEINFTFHSLNLFPGAFTTNVVAAAPVVYCKSVLDNSTTVSLRVNWYTITLWFRLFTRCDEFQKYNINL